MVGASAGGIDVLETVLAPLPWDFPGAVFIVLHTSTWQYARYRELAIRRLYRM